MIYIVVKTSCECDSLENATSIVYASTSKDKAERAFSTHCENIEPSDDWYESFDLYECIDGFNSFISFDGMTRIRHHEVE